MIPYGKQTIDDDDVQAVVDVLRGDWLTTGPTVARFESALAEYVGAEHAVAISSGTAALHAMVNTLDIGQGDEVIVPSMTFAATANAVVFEGGTPVFVDVDPHTLCIDPAAVAAAVTPQTKAIIAVDYAGLPCDYPRLQEVAESAKVPLLTDGCHALGAALGERRVGAITLMTSFSFHPVKPLTTAEGGAITTDDAQLAAHMRRFRNHGLDSDARLRQANGTWRYSMVALGYNYRLSDLQSALGLSQLAKLDGWIARRQAIAAQYDEAFAHSSLVTPLASCDHATHGRHLYVVRCHGVNRTDAFDALRRVGIGVNVHYLPVHLHPFYQEQFGTRLGMCPVAEAAYEQILSLPIYPNMTQAEIDTVIGSVQRLAKQFASVA